MCRDPGLDEGAELTPDGVKRFQDWYTGLCKIIAANLGPASSSMRSLWRVHEIIGMPVPIWQPIERHGPPLAAVLLPTFSTYWQPRSRDSKETRPAQQAVRAPVPFRQILAPIEPARDRRIPHRLQQSARYLKVEYLTWYCLPPAWTLTPVHARQVP